jgi:hypothetical protein
MKSKLLLIIFIFLAVCFLGWSLFNLEPKEDAALSMQDRNRQNSSTFSSVNVGVGEALRKAERQTEDIKKIKTLWEKQVYPERLKIADIDMPIAFEGEVSEVLKQVILSDIHMIYGHMKSHKIYELHKKISPEEMELSLTKKLSFEGQGRHWPKEHRETFGRIARLDQEDTVVLPEKLIDAYRLAWEARNKDPQKYEKFEFFINWLNTASMKELKEDNPYWLYGRDGVSDENPELASEIKHRLLGDERSNLRFRHPSILEFTYVDQGTLIKEKAEGKLPIGVTLAGGYYLNENNIPVQQALFLYDGNKWHIAFAPPGT